MSKNTIETHKIDEVISRFVEGVFPSREVLKQRLLSGQRLRIYWGVDPTGELLHIGHLVPLRKLRQFQDLGHEVILLIGDFTARIGDPTDKTATRKRLTDQEVKDNVQTYIKQVENVLDFKNNPVQIKYNSGWLSKLTFETVIDLAANFTVQQMLERDMFQERLKNQKPIGLHEFMYPLMQGYDSVAMDVDIEIGGTDQTFNMLAGRTLMARIKNKDKAVLTVRLLTDKSGKKIGKTEGNVIPISSGNPLDLYGGVMSLSDDTIIDTFTACTTLSMSEIDKLAVKMKKENPMEYKKLLASTLVKELYGENDSKQAEDKFHTIVQLGEASDINTHEIAAVGRMSLLEFLKSAKKNEMSSSEIKTLIRQGGVEINDKKSTDPEQEFNFGAGTVVKIGKRNFIKVI